MNLPTSYQLSIRLRLHSRIGHSKIDSSGLFCTLPMPKGFLFGEYAGYRVDPEKTPLNPNGKTYYWELSNGLVIDGLKDGNDTRCLNHSCNPNCEAQEIETNQGLRVVFVTTRAIRIGAELTIDYCLGFPGDNATPAEMRAAKKHLACRCGYKNCRGSMLDPSLFNGA